MEIDDFHKLAQTPKSLIAKNHRQSLFGRFAWICDFVILWMSRLVFIILLIILPFFIFYYIFPYSTEKTEELIEKSVLQKSSTINPTDKRLLITGFESGDLADHRLPEHLEINDPEFIRILYKMEGDDSLKSYAFGLIKGGMTMLNIKQKGGGSTTLISTAGDILGHRNIDTKRLSKLELIRNRLKEIRLAGAIHRMETSRQNQLMSAHLPQYNNITSARLTSIALFGHLPQTTTERFILATTVHYPATRKEKSKKLLYEYAQNWCNSPLLSEFEIKCNSIVKNSFVPNHDPLKLTKSMTDSGYELGILSESSISAIQRIKDETKKLSDKFPDSIVETNLTYQKILPNDILGDNILIQRYSSNEKIKISGFDDTHSIASVAKLIGLLADKPLAMSSIQAYATSNNAQVEEDLRNSGIDESELINRLNEMNVNYHNDSNSLLVGLSQGNIKMSSDNVLRLLSEVSHTTMVTENFSNRESASSAIKLDYSGSLRELSKDLENYEVIVAKSGTDSTRQTTSTRTRKIGVHGKLIALSIQRGDYLFHILIRIHSTRPNDKPICESSDCISVTDLRPLVMSILGLIHSISPETLEDTNRDKI